MQAIQKIARYRVDALLGTGAMGEVYRAYDPVIDRPVAIKIVRPELIAGSGSEQWMQRFRREARAAGRRFHPNIVAILDFGEDNGIPFLAMEYVDGRSLDAVIKASGQLQPSRGIAIISQVLGALGFAHANGIIHRDVKPSNIIVLENDEIKVADFGIARIDASEFTIVGDLLGTPAYMAPEQFSGAPVDQRTDLFAAGVILFEMLTGVKPFRGKSITEIMSLMENRGPEDIGVLNPAVPDALKQVIAKALAFDPSRRYATAGIFAKAIAEAVPDPSGQIRLSDALGREAETRSIVSSEAIALDNGSLGPELLKEIERDLATFIGPVAGIALRRALRQTNDLVLLYDFLGQQLENPRDRAAFLARGDQRAAAAANIAQTAPPPTSPPPTSPSQTSPSQTSRPDAPQAPAAPEVTPNPAAIGAIEASLTQYIGPIAKILVKRELDKCDTLEGLSLVLASHIADERDREAFLRSLRAASFHRG